MKTLLLQPGLKTCYAGYENLKNSSHGPLKESPTGLISYLPEASQKGHLRYRGQHNCLVVFSIKGHLRGLALSSHWSCSPWRSLSISVYSWVTAVILGNSSVHIPRKTNTKTNQWLNVHHSSQLVCWKGFLYEHEIWTCKHQEEGTCCSSLTFWRGRNVKEKKITLVTRLYWEIPSLHQEPLWIPPLPFQ